MRQSEEVIENSLSEFLKILSKKFYKKEPEISVKLWRNFKQQY